MRCWCLKTQPKYGELLIETVSQNKAWLLRDLKSMQTSCDKYDNYSVVECVLHEVMEDEK